MPVLTVVLPTSLVICAIVLGAVGLGGGIYETLLVDRAWPNNPGIIQPNRGGINRGVFWAPVHALYEVALLLSAWMVWSNAYARYWIVVALIAHFGSRAWSFAYFIPRALQFEKMGDPTEAQLRSARQRVRLSRLRPLFEAVAILSLCAVVMHFATFR